MKSFDRIVQLFCGLQETGFSVLRLLSKSDVWIWEIGPDGKELRRCSRCGRRAPVYDRQWVRIRDVPIGGVAKVIWFKVQRSRVECPRCGVVVEKLPFRSRWGRITKRFECWIRELLSATVTVQDVARITGLDYDLIYRIDYEMLRNRLRRAPIPEPKNIAIDEKSFQKGHSYVTIVTDSDTGKVIWVSEGREERSLDEFFEFIGPERCKAIQTAAVDLHPAYHRSVEKYIPQACVVPDKFHIVKRLNEAMDESVRELALKTGEGFSLRSRIRGNELRWIIRRKMKNQTEKNLIRLEHLKKLNEPLYEAYLLKDRFHDFFDFSPRELEKAKRFLIQWAVEAWKTGLKALQNFADYVQRHSNLLLNVIKTARTSAVSEGINTKISVIKRMAYGYCNIEYFMLKILQRCGILGEPT